MISQVGHGHQRGRHGTDPPSRADVHVDSVPCLYFARHEAGEFTDEPFQVGVRIHPDEVVFDAEPVEMVCNLSIEVQLERMGFGIAEKVDTMRSHRLDREDRSVDLPSQRDEVDAPLHGGMDVFGWLKCLTRWV
jgi:hypothetical protein